MGGSIYLIYCNQNNHPQQCNVQQNRRIIKPNLIPKIWFGLIELIIKCKGRFCKQQNWLCQLLFQPICFKRIERNCIKVLLWRFLFQKFLKKDFSLPIWRKTSYQPDRIICSNHRNLLIICHIKTLTEVMSYVCMAWKPVENPPTAAAKEKRQKRRTPLSLKLLFVNLCKSKKKWSW